MKKVNKTSTKTNPQGQVAKPTQGGQAPSANRSNAQNNHQKNMFKESLTKKIVICQKTYDYKDETRDVKGKTERLNAINEMQTLLQDQKTVA